MKMALSGLQSSLIRRFTRGGDASGRGRKERRRKGRKEGGGMQSLPCSGWGTLIGRLAE